MAEIISMIAAVVCVLYGLLVLALHTGTLSCMIWFGLCGLFILFAVIKRRRLWRKLPRWPRIVAAGCIAVVLFSFVVIEGCILSGCFAKGEKNLDYIIVLGAQVTEQGPSSVLRYRLNAAYDYLRENEHTICIVSGGQGFNEPTTEAEGMRAYLIGKGIAEDRIYMEPESSTTLQNLANSRTIIEELSGQTEDVRVGIVTNNFHVFRGVQLAKSVGMTHACGIAAGIHPVYLVNNMVREYFGVLKDLKRIV